MKVKSPLGRLRLLSAIAAGASPILFSVAATTSIVATNCHAQYQLPPQSSVPPASASATTEPPKLLDGEQNTAAKSTHPMRDRAVALAAEAKLALTRGDIAGARRLVEQSKALRVPESAYASNQLRPWQVDMDIARVEQRNSTMQPSAVQLAGGQGVTPNQALHTGPYQAGVDASKVQTASTALLVEETVADAPVDTSLSGADLYRQGVEALTAQNRQRALALFAAAWRKEGELDQQTRNQLKDKLTLLTQQQNAEPVAPQEMPAGMQAVSQEQALLRQRMFREVTTEIAEAERLVNTQPMDALERLRSLRQRVSQSNVEGGARKEYLAMVDRVIGHVEAYVKQNEAAINQQLRNESIEKSIVDDAANKAKLDAEIQTSVDEFNELIRQQRFAEAEVIAKKVAERSPNTEISTVMLGKARIARRDYDARSVQDRKADGILDMLQATEEALIPMNPDEPLTMPSLEQWNRAKQRGESLTYQIAPGERVIREKLLENVSVSFQGRPLTYAVDTIAQMTGIPILLDPVGLAAEGLTPEQPISLELNGNSISLKSALNHILEPLNLTYVVKDEVLKITSRRTVKKQTKVKTYPVGDLVIPIPNFTAGNASPMASALESAYRTQAGAMLVQNPNATSGARLAMGGQGVDPNSGALGQALPMGSPMSGVPVGGMGMGSSGMMGGGMGGMGGGQGPFGGGANADFNTLIDLIQTTIPGEWDSEEETITPFPSNLSLIVNAPLETHEQIRALLEQLRALQNLQVTIEIRFITLSDNFYERMGVDFDFNIDDNASSDARRVLGPEDEGPSTSLGLQAGVNGFGPNAVVPTTDLDLQFRQESFGPVIPSLPGIGFDAASGGQLGFAILSDIEMFFFLNAVQSDTRTNVMQAPKVTMFDGQSAIVVDGAQVPFVTGLNPVVGDFAVAQQPIIAVLHEGTQLSVQSVVTPDKRFVRMTMAPTFTTITNRDRTFTFTGSTSSNSGTVVIGDDGEPLPNNDNEQQQFVGSTVQLPTLGTTNISTTVVVPDGGTILLGGIKRLSEQRVERGVPMLSKIPYINRLFSNIATSRTANTFMMTVTPRIIIPEEEEARLLGTAEVTP